MSVARKGVWTALVAVVCEVGLLAGAGSALAETKTFSFTGKEQEFKVPTGVTSVRVVAVGGAGGNGIAFGVGSSGGAGGRGAVVTGNLAVTAGETLYVEVGGNGATPEDTFPFVEGKGGFNGGGSGNRGGGGGGASDVRTVSIDAEPSPGNKASLESRLFAAAGGGGGGFSDCASGGGGAGGSAERAGHEGFGCAGRGGGGGAGTSTKGGAGGSSGEGAGNEGALGTGAGSTASGGGGGAGLYGGGSGGAGVSAGGGGGGSNLVPAVGIAKLAKLGQAPSVTFIWPVPLNAPTNLTTSLSGEGKEGEQITVNFGTDVTDHATLFGPNAAEAAGIVRYKLYTDSECTKLDAEAGEVKVSKGSVPASPPVSRHAGTYYWQAEYEGDEHNEASTSECGAEVLTVARAPTTTTTTLSGEGKSGEQITVKEGASVSDLATLSTATGEAEGTVTYSVYSDNECKNLVMQAGTGTVTGGNAGPSESQTLSAGTYYWQAEYSGDANNKGSSSTCGAEVLTVTQATTTTVKCSPASLVAGGSTTCTATVKDEASSGATTPTGNVAFKTSGSGSFSKASCALAGSGATASCSVTYKPTATPKEPERSDTITAKYEGDETHEATEGSTTVTVISYSQTISGLVNGKLVVKAGQSVLLSSKARVNGRVTIEPGGALDVEGARINGGLTANKATRLRVCGARVNGSGVASNGSGKVVIGEGTTGCPGNRINGPLTITGNSAGVQIIGNKVNGSLTVTGNAVGTTVTHNTITGNLTVTGNTGIVVDKPNTVLGKSEIQ